ncbi:putative exoribonuclease [Hamiltosporidium tvaerminnensis]|uniref:Putative exoribonuclease n=1 Tax=Hamiltosporidium tvaerminnensis TaxID=1176355 RepID=A0A4Q9LAR7_9MICR|nr:hypothetical protein LUQ84_000436 [Hamiltosporidium tvaerminnensis]TBU04566.1 putative exoribonuclease [Hamiltosporidium tvaerminnensis]TBU14424.1 putative exoribonuclease [Hamiltosporidium tvaerminnensis]
MEDIKCNVGVLKDVLGSSMFSFKGTVVYCAVLHMSEPPLRHEDDEKAYVEVKCKTSSHFHSKELERYISNYINKIIHKFCILEADKFKMMQINIFISEKYSNILCCAINSCLLALLDAGIPLRKMFYAVSTCQYEEEAIVFEKEKESFIHIFSHAFGKISADAIQKAKKDLEILEEYILFSLRDKFILVD